MATQPTPGALEAAVTESRKLSKQMDATRRTQTGETSAHHPPMLRISRTGHSSGFSSDVHAYDAARIPTTLGSIRRVSASRYKF